MKKILLFSLISAIVFAQKQTTATLGQNYYRVTVKGFTCNRQTNDDMLERDGKGDEIYFSSMSVMVNNIGKTIPSTSVRNRTRTMGDVYKRALEEKRVIAGSASGNLGGIVTLDNVPIAEPWKNNQMASGDLLPFVLWEGNLMPNSDYVMIAPSIMEYDGPDDFLTNFWHNSLVGKLFHLPYDVVKLPYELVTRGPIDYINDRILYNYDESTPGIFPAPSVMQQFPNQFFKLNYAAMNDEQKQDFVANNKVKVNLPADRPIGVENGDFVNPFQIRLNNASAKQISSIDFGYGKGIISIRYRDRDELKGDYTVFIAIENLQDASQQNRINVTSNDSFDGLYGYTFRNAFANDKVIDVLNGEKNNGANLVLYQPKGYDSQKFRIKKIDDFYSITNLYNNLSMDILNRVDGNGANVITNSFTPNQDFQLWKIYRYCDGSFIIRNKRTNKVMEVYNASKADFAPLGQMDQNNEANQRWFIEK